MISGSIRAVLTMLAALVACAGNAHAQTYPAKPIRLIVGFAVGGGADLTARIIGQKLSESWGQQVVVDVRAGASGNIAADLAARSAPDGYTLLLIPNSHAVVQSLYRKLSYDPVADFAAVSLIGLYPYVLVIHPSVPAKSVRQLIALAKTRPGQLNYASGGSGVGSHLSPSCSRKWRVWISCTYPIRAAVQPCMRSSAARRRSISATCRPRCPHVRSGKLRALGVTGSKPAGDIPAVADSGLKGFESIGW